jgi:GNAT superfamily N-acetyltransferase
MDKYKAHACVIDLPDGNKAEICYGEEATRELRDHPDLLWQIVEQQGDETYDVPPLPLRQVRVWLRNLLTPVAERIGGFSGNFHKKIVKPLIDILYPPGWFFAPTKKEWRQWIWDEAQSLLDQGNFAIARIEGEIVAICAYKLGGELSDNRGVYEITKSFTLQEFRGQGLNRQLREQVIQMITERHPGAPMMSFTKSKPVIEQCIKLGWRAMSIEEYSQITQRIGRSGLSPQAISAFQYWKGFLFDPIKKHGDPIL